MSDPAILRLEPDDAEAIRDLFWRVYGDTYANDLFYDVPALRRALASGRLASVGARMPGGRLLAHMAMADAGRGATPELGNTVVDLDSRGAGLAWRVGAKLMIWCRERGHAGYLHYPTTDHHIMQRRAVRDGFETGLMLGYIPAATDGKVPGHLDTGLRQAATIVYAPLDIAAAAPLDSYLPERWADLVRALAEPTGLNRTWSAGRARPTASRSLTATTTLPRRGVSRLTIRRGGADAAAVVDRFDRRTEPCRQVDLAMDDPALEALTSIVHAANYAFCGWLPGFAGADVLRLQKVSATVTDFAPRVVNPVARELLHHVGAQLGQSLWT